MQKIKVFFKNPLFISILSFVLLVGVSTIFAINKYIAFWGNLERGEGLMGIIYSFTFLLFTFLFFEKKDWMNFFKLNIFVSLIVLFKEFYQFFILGLGRPESFFGNPTFLAGYLIFSMIFSVILFGEEKKKFWKYFSVIIFTLSILGVFIAETRGTILGLAVGGFFTLIYGAVKGKNINYKKFNLRKISVLILCLSILFSGIFFFTRENVFWQKVPGLSRIAVISLSDSTTSTRLLNQKTSLKSVNPIYNGAKVLLVGYGQDNFGYAYGKYFNPSQFEDEMIWFDKSHNKFLDVLVMNGILGLIAYLSIFVIFFIILLRKKSFSWTRAGLLFGVVVYLIHLFFVFDHPINYIMLFSLFSFLVYLNIDRFNFIKLKNKEIPFLGIILLFLFMILSFFAYIKNDLVAYSQMREFSSLVNTADTRVLLKGIDSVLYPSTVSQQEVIKDLFKITKRSFNQNDKDIIKLSEIAIEEGDKYHKENPSDFIFMFHLSSDYTFKGNKLKNLDMLKKGESYARELIDFSPNRPDFNYLLAINTFYQKKHDESFKYLEKAFDLSPKYYLKNKEESKILYNFYVKYFFEKKDLDSLKKIFNRIKENNSTESITLGKIIDYIEKNKTWPTVRFE